MIQWQGTFLSAAFVTPSRLWSELPNLLAAWHRSGLIDRGRAQWLELSPDQVSYERILDGQEAFEDEWAGGTNALVDLSRQYTLSKIVFPFSWQNQLGELMIDFLVYPDNSVGVYLNAPYQSIYEDVPLDVGEKNLTLFVDVACAIFAPEIFVVGCIKEEAQFNGLDSLINEEQLPADWAFYGAIISNYLQASKALSSQPLELRKLRGNGLFVRWTEWKEPPDGPIEWQRSLAGAVDRLKIELA